MERYVVSRYLAEKLKEVGYPQYNYNFYWTLPNPDDSGYEPFVVDEHGAEMYEKHRKAAAPLSDELLEQLPQWLKLFRNDKHVYWAGMVSDGYYNGKNWPDSAHAWFDSKKPADALAQLWLWCKENGHLPTKEAEQ